MSRVEPRDAETHRAQSRATLDAVQRMEAALAANSNDMAAHFHDDFVWRGNVGCGTKHGIAAFRRNWQLPLRAAFSDRVYITERFLADGEWAACFGHIEATHSGTFMGIAFSNADNGMVDGVRVVGVREPLDGDGNPQGSQDGFGVYAGFSSGPARVTATVDYSAATTAYAYRSPPPSVAMYGS